MENPWHNSAFEGSGFVQLFLPVNSENQNYFTRYNGRWVLPKLKLLLFYMFIPFDDLAVVGSRSALIFGRHYRIANFGIFSGLLFLHVV